jgi:hypothetical protein
MDTTYYIETTLNPWELAAGRRETMWQVFADDGAFAPELVGEYLTEEDAQAALLKAMFGGLGEVPQTQGKRL